MHYFLRDQFPTIIPPPVHCDTFGIYCLITYRTQQLFGHMNQQCFVFLHSLGCSHGCLKGLNLGPKRLKGAHRGRCGPVHLNRGRNYFIPKVSKPPPWHAHPNREKHVGRKEGSYLLLFQSPSSQLPQARTKRCK